MCVYGFMRGLGICICYHVGHVSWIGLFHDTVTESLCTMIVVVCNWHAFIVLRVVHMNPR